MLDRLVQRICRTQQAAYHAVKTEVRNWSRSFVLFLQDRDRPDAGAVLKVGGQDFVSEGLRRAAHGIRAVVPTIGQPHLAPRVLEEGSFEGHCYVLEERLGGCDADRLLGQGWPAGRLGDAAWDFLDNWMRSTRRVVRLDEPAFQEWVLYQPQGWQRAFGTRTAETLVGMAEMLRDHFLGRETTTVATHGDYHLGNLLFDGDTGAITGVLDWESASLWGNPLTDSMTLLNRPAINFFPEDAEGVAVDCLVARLNQGLALWDEERLQRVRSDYGLTTQEAGAALFRIFLSRHRSRGPCFREGTRGWVEALRAVIAQALAGNGSTCAVP
jgi:hypothetical protein